ncbi:MAG: chaperone modulator CbpM [Pseudomonadota bacterium]
MAYCDISAVARRLGLRPQTILVYVREGLLKVRSEHEGPCFEEEDIQELERIVRLRRDLGINLAGIEVILQMRQTILEMQERLRSLTEEMDREVQKRVSSYVREMEKLPARVSKKEVSVRIRVEEEERD